jgi:serine/threonine protein kinase
MAMLTGTRLGPYEIVSALGAGGMGEVYRAHDTKLGRDVAIKILPHAFVSDPERVARFEREARTLASLNHSNIGAIYGLEKAHDATALVLELVQGPTLADRIADGPIPIDQALAIARQIAEALEAAHEQGIIHRDLKPANVKVREDGTVKVLDFGLAKTIEGMGEPVAHLTISPTLTSPAMTMHGTILGTAAYMAPEQAKGKPVDKRADIWAFGCVLYEMVTGEQLFRGEDVTDVLASVVKDQPDVSKAPPIVQRLLKKCLEKDLRHRLRDIGDAWELLIDDASPDRRPAARKALLPWAVAAVWAVAAAALGVLVLRQTPAAAPPLVMFQLAIPEEAGAFNGIVSPDGRRILYSSGNQVWVRDLSSIAATRILEADAIITQPFWSADSRFVVFSAAGVLKKADGSGGPAQTLCALTGTLIGGFTTGDRMIFATSGGGLFQVPAAGGAASPLALPRPMDRINRAGDAMAVSCITSPLTDG